MDQLVECVPNISDGRRLEVVDAIAAAVERVPGVTLLDRTSDADHDRSVLTLAGDPVGVSRAMRGVAVQTIARIDLRAQRGEHPRVGALDVVPFVPLGDTSMDVCIETARDFGAWLARQFTVPVYLYARAATRSDRRVLSDIRRPGFEGLSTALGTEAGTPDYGPRRPHPSAGATVVGARPALIAWNIQLESEDVGLARRIASAIRERDGGLPAVQALGIPLVSQGCVQVSMNLLDHGRTPMWRVLEEVRGRAEAAGAAVRDSELIGLAPLRAFLETADHIGIDQAQSDAGRVIAAGHWLGIRGATSDMALELRLDARRSQVRIPAIREGLGGA